MCKLYLRAQLTHRSVLAQVFYLKSAESPDCPLSKHALLLMLVVMLDGRACLEDKRIKVCSNRLRAQVSLIDKNYYEYCSDLVVDTLRNLRRF